MQYVEISTPCAYQIKEKLHERMSERAQDCHTRFFSLIFSMPSKRGGGGVIDLNVLQLLAEIYRSVIVIVHHSLSTLLFLTVRNESPETTKSLKID